MGVRTCSNCKYCGSGTNEYPCNDCYYGLDEPLDTTPLRWTAKPQLEPAVVEVDNPVSHPSHYTQGGIECIQAMEAAYGKEAVATFCLLNAFKYLWRSEHKNGLEDIKKAEWYLNKYKELRYGE